MGAPAFTATASAATAALILSTRLLMPGQPNAVAATEMIAVAISAVTARIQVRTDRKRSGCRAVPSRHAWSAPMTARPSSWLVRSPRDPGRRGLYWVVPALLVMIRVSIISAWVMLVEILR